MPYRVRDPLGGLGAVPSCSLKGCAIVAVGRSRRTHGCRRTRPNRPGRGRLSATSHTLHRKDDPVRVGRSGGRDPGACLRAYPHRQTALCLPPATLEQAFSLQSRPPILSCALLPTSRRHRHRRPTCRHQIRRRTRHHQIHRRQSLRHRNRRPSRNVDDHPASERVCCPGASRPAGCPRPRCRNAGCGDH